MPGPDRTGPIRTGLAQRPIHHNWKILYTALYFLKYLIDHSPWPKFRHILDWPTRSPMKVIGKMSKLMQELKSSKRQEHVNQFERLLAIPFKIPNFPSFLSYKFNLIPPGPIPFASHPLRRPLTLIRVSISSLSVSILRFWCAASFTGLCGHQFPFDSFRWSDIAVCCSV